MLLDVVNGAAEMSWTPLLNMGGIGVVLVWFMFRSEPRLRAIEASIDRLARALMVAVMANRACDAALKEQAQAIVDEVDTAHTKK